MGWLEERWGASSISVSYVGGGRMRGERSIIASHKIADWVDHRAWAVRERVERGSRRRTLSVDGGNRRADSNPKIHDDGLDCQLEGLIPSVGADAGTKATSPYASPCPRCDQQTFIRRAARSWWSMCLAVPRVSILLCPHSLVFSTAVR